MSFLRPPNTDYKNTRDIGKFNMIWNISLVLTPILGILAFILLISGFPSYLSAIIGFGLASLNLVILTLSKKYQVVTVYSIVICCLLVQTLIFIVDPTRIVPATLWTIMIAIFSYYMLGPIFGAAALIFNIIGIIFFMAFGSFDDISQSGLSSLKVEFSLLFDVGYVTVGLMLFIGRFMKTNRETYALYEQQIKQNEFLLKEIHHRVKNNLSIVASLLKLQAMESKNKDIRDQFDEAVGRIKSMSLIHEKMYQNDDLSMIDLEQYLNSLGKDILSSFRKVGEINIEITCERIMVDTKNIVPVSLILNELLTNSVKHAFRDKTDGEIKVDVTRKDGFIKFIYTDNGTWKDELKEGSFGLDLLQALTFQLGGTIDRSIGYGTTYELRFPENNFKFDPIFQI